MNSGLLRLKRLTLLSQTLRTRPSIGKFFLLIQLLIICLGTGYGLEACYCDTINTEFNFTNNAGVVQYYTIQKSGEAASWSIITPRSFSLSPGESELVVAFIRVDCDAPEGTAGLTLRAVGESDVITKSINISVSSCHSITILHNQSYSSCINDELVIPLRVINDGGFPEQVTLRSSAGMLSAESFNLSQGDSRSVSLVLIPDKLGTESVVVEAFFSGELISTDLIIESVQCSFFNASLSRNFISLCESEESVINLTLINQAEPKDIYLNSSSLLVNLPELVTDFNETIILPVRVYSNCESGLIQSIIKVWASGARTIELPLVINVKSCDKPVIVSEKQSDIVCGCELINYSFTLFNPSSQSITYALSPSVGELLLNSSPLTSVSLGSGEQVELMLHYQVPCQGVNELLLGVNATSITECSKSSGSNINLTIDSWSDCEAVSLDSHDLVVVNDSDVTVPVSVRNIGLRPASYNIIVTGSSVNNLLGLSKGFVTLDPGVSEEIELLFSSDELIGGYVIVKAFSTDNMASDEVMISFGSGLTVFDIYFLLVPASVLVLIILYLLRGKFFNKLKSLNKK